ncbi:hypothetical protein PIB30_094121 [Stylosanthes scabra]|uniref:Uncharacterized protein n=1 Tax=Stylosanthes scabra TaxID=79078 RepID=A0ABU6XV02_9FABA|nr:hypothetical protein [Stylosanthes scabra]
MECFITWQLEPENSGLLGRKPIINSLLNKTNEPKKRGTFTSSFPRICVEVHAYAWKANKLTFQSHVYITSNVTFTSPSLIHPCIGVEDPRICVEGTLAASNHAEPKPESLKRDSKPR